MSEKYRLSPYRWVVLGVFMLINLTIQTLWISYASISGPAAAFYGVTDMQIGLFAMSFMIAFIPLSIPVSWAIDTIGFKKSVGFGVVLMGVFGLLRGLIGTAYAPALACTIMLAMSQPFLLNSWTKVPALWFPVNQRATAVGMVTICNLIGTALGLVLTPILFENGHSINHIQFYYGLTAAVSAVLFLIFAREKPKTPPCASTENERALMLDGLKHAFTVAPFILTLVVAFIGLGIFNGVTTWIENIIRTRGFTPTDAGTLGAIMIGGGLIGAIVLPALSDKENKRQKYLFIALIGALPGLLGVTFATTPIPLFMAAFILGFFLVSALPIAMQYAAEVTHPTPEGTSNGLIQLFGQGAVVFVYVMELLKTEDGSFTPSLLAACAFLVVSLLAVSKMKDPIK